MNKKQKRAKARRLHHEQREAARTSLLYAISYREEEEDHDDWGDPKSDSFLMTDGKLYGLIVVLLWGGSFTMLANGGDEDWYSYLLLTGPQAVITVLLGWVVHMRSKRKRNNK